MRRGPGKEQSCADPLGTLPWLRRFTFTHPPTGGGGGVGCHRTVGLTDPHTSTLSPTPAAPRTPPAAADFTTRPCDLKSPSPITLLPPSPPSLYPGAASTKMAAAPPHAAP